MAEIRQKEDGPDPELLSHPRERFVLVQNGPRWQAETRLLERMAAPRASARSGAEPECLRGVQTMALRSWCVPARCELLYRTAAEGGVGWLRVGEVNLIDL